MAFLKNVLVLGLVTRGEFSLSFLKGLGSVHYGGTQTAS
jgi:hypothetical protein